MGSPQQKDSHLKDHPLLAYFGALCDPLDRDQAQKADFTTRIESIGQLLVREVLIFHRMLSPQGRINYDPEDILLEVWIELRKRNEKYDKERGGYRTFAARIIHNTFLAISERSRCVKLPANSAATFNAQSAGTLEDGDRERFALISQAARDLVTIETNGHSRNEEVDSRQENSRTRPLLQDRRPSPVDGLIWLEDYERINSDIADQLEELTTLECLAIGVSASLWGNPIRTLKEVACEYNVEPTVLRKALRSARNKLSKKESE